MSHLLHLRADTSLPAIQLALARLKPREIALVFPAGEPVALAPSLDTTELIALHNLCTVLDKDVVIIGGNETLRAAAVAAGFAAATSVEEWKDASGWRFARPALALQVAHDVHPPLALVDDDSQQVEEVDYDVLPEYVQLLLHATDAQTSPLASEAEQEARLARHASAPHDDEEEAPTSTAERYEDGITATIRDTSGVTEWATGDSGSCDTVRSASDEDQPSAQS